MQPKVQIKLNQSLEIVEVLGAEDLSLYQYLLNEKTVLLKNQQVFRVPNAFYRWFLSQEGTLYTDTWECQQKLRSFKVSAIVIGEVILITFVENTSQPLSYEATVDKGFFWDNFLMNFSQGVLILDLQGHILESNNITINLLVPRNHHGVLFSREGLLQKNVDLLLDKELSQKIKEYFSKAILNRKLIFSELYRVHNRTIEIKIYPNIVERRVDTFSMLITDVSEQIKTQENLRTLEKERYHQSRLASIGELAAGVGHEINNPLTIALGNMMRLKREMAKEEPDLSLVSKFLEKQETSLVRIKNIVSGLRSFARSDSLLNEKTNMYDLVNQTVMMIKEIYARLGVEIQFDCQNKNIFSMVNTGKIQQVLMNLFANAKDVLVEQSGGVIRVNLSERDGSLFIVVEDNGSGIPVEAQSKIFEAFFTTKEVGRGTGLGLSISSSIISEHDGKLSFESSQKGTKFFIELPVFEDVSKKMEVMTDKKRQTALQRQAVLVIDDEVEIRDIYSEFLADLGCQVEVAENGKMALEMVKKKRYDIIFSDLNMPVLDGFSFVKKIQELDLIKGSYLYVITGGAPSSFEPKAFAELKNIIDDIFFKPCHSEVFEKILSKIEINQKKAS